MDKIVVITGQVVPRAVVYVCLVAGALSKIRERQLRRWHTVTLQSSPEAETRVGSQSVMCINWSEARPVSFNKELQTKAVPRTPPSQRVNLVPLSGQLNPELDTAPHGSAPLSVVNTRIVLFSIPALPRASNTAPMDWSSASTIPWEVSKRYFPCQEQ